MVEVEAVTTVSFECVNLPVGDVARIIGMIRHNEVDVFLGSPQAIMELEPEEALAAR